MDLLPHNQKAYNELKEALKTTDRVAIVQATGTGKSFIITQYVLDNTSMKGLILAPNDKILNEYKKADKNIENLVDLAWYPRILSLYKKGLLEYFYSGYDYIVLDELHRVGAPRWGEAIDNLLEINNPKILIGASATPIRQGDINQPLIKYFNNVTVGNLSTSQAIKEGILPELEYISCYYELNKRIDYLKGKALAKNNLEIVESLENIRVEWEESYSVKEVLAGRLSKDKPLKILSFSSNIEELKQHERILQDYLAEIYPDYIIKFYPYYTGCKNEDTILDTFVKLPKLPKTINIILSVGKLNEGVHIKGLTTLFFFRKTYSNRIYSQQLGRILSVGAKGHLQVFDFVNNSLNVKEFRAWQTSESTESNTAYMESEPRGIIFRDYLSNFTELLESIELELNKIYTYNNITGTASYICKKLNIPHTSIYKRMDKGLNFTEAIEDYYSYKINSIYTYNNITGTASYICKKLNISRALISTRMNEGLSFTEAIEDYYLSKNKIYTYNNITGTASYICKELKIPTSNIYRRMGKGLNFTEAIEDYYNYSKSKIHIYNNLTGSINYICNELNIHSPLIYTRMKNNMTLKEAIDDYFESNPDKKLQLETNLFSISKEDKEKN